MDIVFQLIAIIAILAGTFFTLAGVMGLIRLPDVYSRLHATGKVGVFGVVLFALAAAAYTPLGWSRALLLAALLMITGPVSAHAISSAAHRINVPLRKATRDDLAAANEPSESAH